MRGVARALLACAGMGLAVAGSAAPPARGTRPPAWLDAPPARLSNAPAAGPKSPPPPADIVPVAAFVPATPPPPAVPTPPPAPQQSLYPPPPTAIQTGTGPLPGPNAGPLHPTDTPLPINLATALHLANARPLDVQIAGRQVAVAAAQLDRARLLWVPNLVMGVDWFHHDGLQQNFEGALPRSSRSTLMAGAGPNVVFAFSDAVYAPLAARQDVRARQAFQQAAINDVALDVAEAYFTVQQARGELAGAIIAERQADDLVRRATALARGLAPPLEETRAKVELARRRQVAIAARERWRVAGAELSRLLRLDPSAVVEPAEPPFLPVTVIDPNFTLDELIPVGLTSRPELGGQQAVVQATLARLKQEKIRPLVPSLAIRSVSTNPSGSLGYGTFGGGRGSSLKEFGERFDIDVQLLWEFQALGFGNKARVNERRAEHEVATLELFRTQDRIAAEVATAFAQVRSAAERLNEAEPALREAIDLVNRNIEGLGQTRRVGEVLVLVVRPQEAVAAVQSLGQATTDFFAAVADYNRAQFRLYRALGHPAQCLAGSVAATTGADPTAAVPPEATLSDRRPQPVVGQPVTPAAAAGPTVSVVPPVVPPPPVAPPVLPVAPGRLLEARPPSDWGTNPHAISGPGRLFPDGTTPAPGSMSPVAPRPPAPLPPLAPPRVEVLAPPRLYPDPDDRVRVPAVVPVAGTTLRPPVVVPERGP